MAENAFVPPARPGSSSRTAACSSAPTRGNDKPPAAITSARMNATPSSARTAPRGFAHVETWVFDLDNTLYPHHLNLWQQVDERIRAYIMDFLKSATRRRSACRRTIQALRHLDARADDRARHESRRVSRLSCTRSIIRRSNRTPRSARRSRTARPKADPHQRHARPRRRRDAAARHPQKFEDVFDIIAAELEPKPLPQTYDRFLKLHGVDPARAAMFEDLSRNLAVPHTLGMTTVLVVPEGTREVFRENLGNGRPRRRPCGSRHRRSGGFSAAPRRLDITARPRQTGAFLHGKSQCPTSPRPSTTPSRSATTSAPPPKARCARRSIARSTCSTRARRASPKSRTASGRSTSGSRRRCCSRSASTTWGRSRARPAARTGGTRCRRSSRAGARTASAPRAFAPCRARSCAARPTSRRTSC